MSNPDYDPQYVLLHCRMVNRIALSKKIVSGIGAIKRISIILWPLPPRMIYIMALSNHNLTIAAWYGVNVVKLCGIIAAAPEPCGTRSNKL